MLDKKPNFPKIEEKILKFWEENKIFEKSISQNKGGKDFIFYEGPPTANAKPGIHHVLARAFKDVILRYRTMRGEYVPRRAGWDTHGLPVEIEVEKQLGLKGKKDVLSLVPGGKEKSIIKFNKKCKENVFQYKKDWEDLTSRMGFWIDMDDAYVTFKDDYIEKVWGILKKIYDKGLLYNDYKVVPFCPRCGTALSSHEVAQGYKNIEEDSVFVKFKVCRPHKSASSPRKSALDEYFLVWTTTPWTLPANVALAVGEKIPYVKVKVKEEILILAEALLDNINEKYEIVETIKGKDLLGLKYEPLYKFIDYKEKAHYIVPAEFVSTDEGTGIVHTAVMYGEDDFNIGTEIGLPKEHLINEEGKFIKSAGKFAGMFVKQADPKIIADLKERELLYKKEKVTHKYPFCWRCDTILIYYARKSWYINISKIRNELVKNNDKINWVPKHLKYGRFGKWLKGAKDWAISRERFWGIPLPIWQCQKCKEHFAMGSKKELGVDVELHRPYVDKVELKCKCGGTAKRVPEVIDVWFDSGAMPYASEEKEKDRFPADYIVEAVDQTRGWFYTLLAISTLLDDGTSYKNVISLGHVLDEKGKKMSKSLGNIVDPIKMMEKYGADVLRFHFYTINQPGEPKRFNEKELLEVTKKVLLIFWNSTLFFQTYSDISMWKKGKEKESKNILDKWIVSRLGETKQVIIENLQRYDIYKAGLGVSEFVTDLSTWYIRRSRKRFFKNEDKNDERAAFETLRFVLVETSKILAPFTPFVAEEIFLTLRDNKMNTSVHLEKLEQKEEIDEKVLDGMKKTRVVIKKALEERAKAGIKVRQPLSKLEIPEKLGGDFIEIVKDEVNIKEVIDSKRFRLDTKITPELKKEGILREFIRNIQNLRKKKGKQVGDRVIIAYDSEFSEINDLLNNKDCRKQIMKEVSSIGFRQKDFEKGKIDVIEIEGKKIYIQIR